MTMSMIIIMIVVVSYKYDAYALFHIFILAEVEGSIGGAPAAATSI